MTYSKHHLPLGRSLLASVLSRLEAQLVSGARARGGLHSSFNLRG